MDIYATYDDLLNSCTENPTPPIAGCMAFVLETHYIYVQLPGDDCDWAAWVSGGGGEVGGGEEEEEEEEEKDVSSLGSNIVLSFFVCRKDQ